MSDRCQPAGPTRATAAPPGECRSSDAPLGGALRRGRAEHPVVFIHSALDDYGLGASEFRVLCHLARRAGDGTAFPAIRSIAGTCRLHAATVRKAIQSLIRLGLLARQLRPGWTCLYALQPPSRWKQPPTFLGTHSKTDVPHKPRQAPPAKRMQGNPSESGTAEGNPPEGDPSKVEHIQAPGPSQNAHCLPLTETEAVAAAGMVGVPGEFALQEWLRMRSVDWRDGCQRQVKSWPHYVRMRWTSEQSRRAERAMPRFSRSGGPPTPPRNFGPTDHQGNDNHL